MPRENERRTKEPATKSCTARVKLIPWVLQQPNHVLVAPEAAPAVQGGCTRQARTGQTDPGAQGGGGDTSAQTGSAGAAANAAAVDSRDAPKEAVARQVRHPRAAAGEATAKKKRPTGFLRAARRYVVGSFREQQAEFLEAWDYLMQNKRQLIFQTLNLLLVVMAALMIWKMLMLYSNSESPVVVVLSGSMRPAFDRGDLLFLTNDYDDPVRVGEIIVFKVKERDIPLCIEL